MCTEEESDSSVEDSREAIPEPSVIKISSVWKKVFKNPLAQNKGYRKEIKCRRCRKIIPDYVWFYSKVCGRNQKNIVYYCENCYTQLWYEP